MIMNSDYDSEIQQIIVNLLDEKIDNKSQLEIFPDHKYSLGGMVKEISYNQQKIKILAILKEANDPDANPIREYVRNIVEKNENLIRTWRNVSRWVTAVYSNGNCNFEDIDETIERDALEKIAVTNINKGEASSKTYMPVLKKKALKQSKVLLKELEILKPNIILCGGTYNIFCEIIEKEGEIGKDYCYFNDILIINMYHPQARIKDIDMYNSICNILRNLS